MSCGAFQVVDPGDDRSDLEVIPVMPPEHLAGWLRWVNTGEREHVSRVRPGEAESRRRGERLEVAR